MGKHSVNAHHVKL